MKKFHFAAALAFFVLFAAAPLYAQYKDVMEEWQSVQPPKAPELKPVTLDNSTAVLLLDFVKQTCNNERRPRCLQTIPRVAALLKQARSKGVMVVYSLAGAATADDILKEIAPQGGEPMVKAPADKFFGTDLDKILKDKGIKTVIVTGTAAQGAVLNTASQAAFRGLKVVIPVDGMSAENTYYEQYTAYHMTTAPGVAQQTTLTRIDMIK